MGIGIKARSESIREGYTKLITQHREDTKRKEREHAEYLEHKAQGVIYKLYDKLDDVIYYGCGIEDNEIKGLYLNKDLRLLGNDITKVYDRVEELTGLRIVVDPEREHIEYINVILCEIESAKACDVEYDDQIYHLNFAKLLRENTNRNELWPNFLPDFAQDIVKKCDTLLQDLPYNHFGIADTTEVHIELEKGVFNRELTKFDYYNVKAAYRHLTPQKLANLAEAMNKIISHATVEIKMGEHYLRFFFTKDPNKVIEQPYFDYQNFYSKHDNIVADKLKYVFNTITHTIQLDDKANQILSLTPSYRLVYKFPHSNSEEFPLYKEYLIGGPHERDLFTAIETKYPGIKITSAKCLNREEPWRSFCRCGAHGVDSLNERIEFAYEIIDNTSELKQAETDIIDTIAEIKTKRLGQLANLLACKIIGHIEELGINYFVNAKGKIEPIKLRSEMTTIHLNDAKTGYDYDINLKSVQDMVFIKRLEAEVKRQTDGLLDINIQKDVCHIKLRQASNS